MNVRLTVRVTPRASSDAVTELDADGVLHVRVTAPPADGRANERVVQVIASALGVRRGDVRLVRGERGRTKLVEVPLPSLDAVRERLSSSR